MKALFRRSVGEITRRTPRAIRQALGPAVNPLLGRWLDGARDAAQGTAYIVRPLHPPTERGPRVLHFIGNFLTGGSSKLIVDLYEHLGHRYVQKVVAQLVPTPPAYVGIPVVELRERASHEPFLAQIREFRPDLVHIHYWGDCDTPWYERVFEAARIAGCRVIENVNTPVAPFLAEEVREYVYVSEYVRRTFGTGAKETTIYPGADFSMFRAPHWPSRPGTLVGMVYRLEPDKLDASAIEPMIEAARIAPELRFLVVGGGSLLDAFKARVRASGNESRFEFAGYVPYASLPRLYRKLALFVAPVWKESFGQVSSFAMNMGIPVAGYDVGALAEIVDDPALLAPAGDSAALGRIIAELMRDAPRRRRLGAKGRARATSLFSVEAMAQAYDRVYAAQLANRA